MTHKPGCPWLTADCSYKETHEYCPHQEHACTCPPESDDPLYGIPYRTPACDKHLKENDSDECPWCELATAHVEIGQLRTALTDIREFFARRCKEGDVEYQAVIVADQALQTKNND